MSLTAILLLIAAFLVLIGFFFQLPHLPRRTMDAFLHRHYAHRGYWNESMPENSLPAFENALKHGYGIELDVQRTRDHELVVFHDHNLLRMCQVDRELSDFTLRELRSLRLKGSDESIPTLAEVLSLVHGQVPLLIEIKTASDVMAIARSVDALLRQYSGPYMIESFDARALLWFRMHHRQVRRGQLAYGIPRNGPYPRTLLNRLLSTLLTDILSRPDFIAFDVRTSSAISLRFLRLFRPWMVAWTVKTQKEIDDHRKDFDLFIFESFPAR